MTQDNTVSYLGVDPSGNNGNHHDEVNSLSSRPASAAVGAVPPAQSRPGTAAVPPRHGAMPQKSDGCPPGCFVRLDARPMQRQLLRRASWADGTLHADTVAGEELPESASSCGELLWRSLCCLDIVFRAFGQVYFANNPIAGMLMFVGIAIGSNTYGGLSLLACVSATVSACAMQQSRRRESTVAWADIIDGLYGYDGVLVGGALDTFIWPMVPDGAVYPAVLIFAFALGGGASAPFVRAMCVRIVRGSGIPVFTIAFNIVGLTLLYGGTHAAGIGFEATPVSQTHFEDVSNHWRDPMFFVEAFSRGVSQLCFVENFIGSWFVVAALFFCDFGAAALACTGSICGAVFAVVFAGAFSPSGRATHLAVVVAVRRGLFGYNACAAACVPHIFALAPADVNRGESKIASGIRCAVAAVGISALTTGIQMALSGAMTQPVLTLPFVLASWAVLGAIGVPAPPTFVAPEHAPQPRPESQCSVNPLIITSPSPRRTMISKAAAGSTSTDDAFAVSREGHTLPHDCDADSNAGSPARPRGSAFALICEDVNLDE